jgi:hypothetical protein
VAKFQFTGDQQLTYPTIVVNGATLVAEPGQTYELPEAPDGRWSEAGASASPPAPKPAEVDLGLFESTGE